MLSAHEEAQFPAFPVFLKRMSVLCSAKEGDAKLNIVLSLSRCVCVQLCKDQGSTIRVALPISTDTTAHRLQLLGNPQVWSGDVSEKEPEATQFSFGSFLPSLIQTFFQRQSANSNFLSKCCNLHGCLFPPGTQLSSRREGWISSESSDRSTITQESRVGLSDTLCCRRHLRLYWGHQNSLFCSSVQGMKVKQFLQRVMRKTAHVFQHHRLACQSSAQHTHGLQMCKKPCLSHEVDESLFLFERKAQQCIRDKATAVQHFNSRVVFGVEFNVFWESPEKCSTQLARIQPKELGITNAESTFQKAVEQATHHHPWDFVGNTSLLHIIRWI